ncbi:MAG TPA: ROK family protein [Terriglobales bacterium]|nr:ROK family protein [Terriglobales bacterium]
MPDYSIGVDLGGTNLRIAAVGPQGNLLEKITLGTRVALGRDRVVRDMCDAVERVRAEYRGRGSLLGIGIGVPGIIDMNTGMVHESPNLPDWANYPVRGEIERRLGTRVVLENDANSAALGEKWLGAARDVADMAMLTLGTGVGGGLVVGGRVWHGMIGMAGEFGHFTVEPDGVRCGCGNHGCLEAYASATAIVRMAREAIAVGAAPELSRVAGSDPEFSAKVVYNLAVQGDEQAREIFRRVGRALGIVLSSLVNALNLPMYVIGGGVASAWEAFSPAMFEELRKRSMVYAATAPELSEAGGTGAYGGGMASAKTLVTRALLGSDAGLFGAARLALLDGDQPKPAKAS